MGITIIQAPYRNRETPSQVSLWSGLFNPIIFTALRADYTIQKIDNINGVRHNIWCYGTPADLYTLFADDPRFYVRSGGYDQIVEAYAVVQSSPTMFIIKTYSLPNDGDTTGGYINFTGRKNYYAELTITSRGNTYTVRRKPDNRGEMIIDVSTALKGILELKNDFLYDVVNRGDNNLSEYYNVSYQEFWTNSNETLKSLVLKYYYVNGGKQLKQLYGSNYAEYVPFLTQTTPAKFLTKFVNPVYWEGYPFDLSWIYPNHIKGYTLKEHEQELDFNDTEVQVVDTDLISSAYSADQPNIGVINRMQIRGGYADEVKHVNVSIELNEAYNNFAYGKDDYHKSYWSKQSVIPIENTMTGIVKLKIGTCPRQPIYLCWINSLGGWDYWLFDKTQEVSKSVFEEDSYQPYVTDIETADSREDFIRKRSREEVKLGASDLTQNEATGLAELLSSPKVYEMQPDGSREVVLVKKKTFVIYKTDAQMNEIEFVIERQEDYLQGAI